MSSLCRGHANILCIVPNFSYVTPKGTLGLSARIRSLAEFWVKYESEGWRVVDEVCGAGQTLGRAGVIVLDVYHRLEVDVIAVG